MSYREVRPYQLLNRKQGFNRKRRVSVSMEKKEEKKRNFKVSVSKAAVSSPRLVGHKGNDLPAIMNAT